LKWRSGPRGPRHRHLSSERRDSRRSGVLEVPSSGRRKMRGRDDHHPLRYGSRGVGAMRDPLRGENQNLSTYREWREQAALVAGIGPLDDPHQARRFERWLKRPHPTSVSQRRFLNRLRRHAVALPLPRHEGRSRAPRPSAPRTRGSRRTSRATRAGPSDEPGESEPPGLALWRHPELGPVSPALYRVLLREGCA
jgi:hypothetical protein